jgi:hypothetical protein
MEHRSPFVLWFRSLPGWLLALVLLLPGAVFAATITVNNNGDPEAFNPAVTIGTLGTTVTLRDAINAANNTPGDDVIEFAPALAGQTIRLLRIGDATFAWLKAALPKLDPKKPTVVLTHFPLGAGVKYRPLNAEAVLERFLDFNLRGAFSGHYHAQTAVAHRGIEVVTNACCARVRENHDGTKAKGYFVANGTPDGTLTREFVPFAG